MNSRRPSPTWGQRMAILIAFCVAATVIVIVTLPAGSHR